MAPLWQVQTTLAHYQKSGEIDLPAQTQSLPNVLSDGLHQSLQVVSLELANALPTETTPSKQWIDVDGDGYAEQTQWVQANQAMLAVDLNGDGKLTALAHRQCRNRLNRELDAQARNAQAKHRRKVTRWVTVKN